jgi:hypothetical protein
VSSPTRPDSTKPLCAETSRAHAESLHATASRVDTWILIEYRGLWAHDAVDGSTLSAALKQHLVAERVRLPHARILFVRRSERRSKNGLAAYIARSTPSERELRCVELERHDDLIGLDLATAGEPVDHPLFLVCTHGKHDRCCAKFGRPLYAAVREQVEDSWAWQSSHVGGDRFAGNLVVLADGAYYGRVEPADAWPVVEAALDGRVHLPLYRGRSCYGFAAQAAEIAVREASSELGVEAVRVRSIVSAGAGWRADVEAAGTAYEVDVHIEEGAPTHLTCSTRRLSRPKRYVGEILRGRAD